MSSLENFKGTFEIINNEGFYKKYEISSGYLKHYKIFLNFKKVNFTRVSERK